MKTVQGIERAIDALPREQLAELYAWLDQHRPRQSNARSEATVFERRLGLFGSPSDSGLSSRTQPVALAWLNQNEQVMPTAADYLEAAFKQGCRAQAGIDG